MRYNLASIIRDHHGQGKAPFNFEVDKHRLVTQTSMDVFKHTIPNAQKGSLGSFIGRVGENQTIEVLEVTGRGDTNNRIQMSVAELSKKDGFKEKIGEAEQAAQAAMTRLVSDTASSMKNEEMHID